MLDPAHKSARDFILANTSLQAPPHVPEIRLHLADEAHDLWHKTEEELPPSACRRPSGLSHGRVVKVSPAIFWIIPKR